MVLSNPSMIFVYASSPRSFAIASRPYNYGLCGVLGRRTWKAYLECLYCKVKAWIHGENNIQTWSRVQVCGYEWKVDSSKILSPNLYDWDHGLSLMLILFFFCSTFFHSSLSLSFIIFSSSLFSTFFLFFYNIFCKTKHSSCYSSYGSLKSLSGICVCPHQDLLLLPQGPTTIAYVEFWVGELERHT